MPFDQSFEIRPVFGTAKTPPVLRLAAAGMLCIAGAFAAPFMLLQYGLAICGGILLLVAAFGKCAEFGMQHANARLCKTARRMIAHDVGVGFVTNSKGIVQFANAGATDRFGETEGRSLASVFELMLANPGCVISQVMAQAKHAGAKTEDIVTRAGHFRLRLLIMGPECQMWWLDELGQGDAKAGKQGKQQTLPLMTVTADGRVLDMNDAFTTLVGASRAHLEEVFDDLPLRSGQAHNLLGANGPESVVVAVTEGRDDTCDVYVLPGASTAQMPPQLEAGWDAIEDLPVPLLKIAQNGAILGSNREARQLLGLNTTAGCHLADVLNDPGRPINDWLSEALAGHAGNVSQFLHGRGKKQDTFVQVTLNTAGAPEDLHLIAVLNDVTELRSLELQFVQSQKMQAIGQLAGGVAHDFNNLLTAISGHCELLLCNHDEHDQDYGDLIQIHQNTNRAASLVGQLLAFSRKQNLQLETIDLRDTLSDLTHLLNRLVGEKVTLTLDHDPQLASIKADKRQLEQVLMNLVVNARDAMKGAGEIRVVTKNASLKKPMHRDRATVPAGEYVLVKVIDEGQGILAEKLGKIFEPFFTTKRPGEGTGLGLSTAYGIVK
ncbi:MAG: ATP-binding protein, partial [Pseudomonadota bacterium]